MLSAVISENDYIKINHNLSVTGLYSNWASPYNSYVEFKNVTLATKEGSINMINDSRVVSYATMGGTTPIPDLFYINILHNLAYVNSYAFPDMNRSAIITLLNTNISNPMIEVDYLGSGSFVICPPSLCRIISFSNGNLTFYVNHFTTYRVSQLTCYMCGDVNGDRVVSMLDALFDARIANKLIIPNPMQSVCGDVNSDGAINVLDALLIARYSSRLPVTLRCR